MFFLEVLRSGLCYETWFILKLYFWYLEVLFEFECAAAYKLHKIVHSFLSLADP